MSKFEVNTARGTHGDQYRSDKFKIGKHCYGSIIVNGHHLLDEMIIGSFCSIGPGVQTIVKGWNHNAEWFTTYPFAAFADKWPNANKIKALPKTQRAIKIGSDVWIGRNALIFSDITIGDGAIIGAYSVVSKDIPPYSIAAGNSMRIIKKRFSDEDIEYLLKLKWWDWPDSKINEYLDIINSNDIDKLKNIQ